MGTKDVEVAVRHVLPALNLRPDQFHLDRGFLARAQHGGAPRSYALRRVTDLFVFVGSRSTTDPEPSAQDIATEALESLSTETRAVCQRLIVGWTAADDQAFAAAFDVLPNGMLGSLLASSWTPPDAWPEPMIDASKSGDDTIDEELGRLESLVRSRNDRGTDFESELNRTLRLVDDALLLHGGEAQSPPDHPSVYAPDRTWSTWLYYFNQSVLDEWNRIGGGVRRELPSPTKPATVGPLKGLRVFLSYARPDATTLAWPVHEALSSQGATVWFDRTLTIDQRQLALGLAETISSYDAYVLCASDEFFERSGYGTQEFAWATQHRESGGKLRHFLVVARPGTILPNAVAAWPTIILRDEDREELARNLVAHLQRAEPSAVTASLSAPLAAPRSVTPLHSLPRRADIPALWRRVQHIRLFEEIDPDTLTEVATSGKDDRQAMEVRRRLMNLGEGLDWTGTLQDIDLWPEDSLIRDARFRFASARAVASTRMSLNDDPDWKSSVVDDVEYLVTRRVPVIDWPAVPGWDDDERRLALRHHAGLLRILQGLLQHGLWGGLVRVPSSTLDAWEKELSTRRRECYDALLTLRLNGLLSWQKDLPTWDALFRSWSELLVRPNGPWREPVPFHVLQLLAGHNTEVAAVGAETGWYASRYGGFASQSFTPRGYYSTVTIEVYALGSAASDPGSVAGTENSVRLGLVARDEASAEVSLSWNVPQFSINSQSGESSGIAPDQLSGAFSLARS